jgi:hypothetical protein
MSCSNLSLGPNTPASESTPYGVCVSKYKNLQNDLQNSLFDVLDSARLPGIDSAELPGHTTSNNYSHMSHVKFRDL